MRYLHPIITLTSRVGPACPPPSPDSDVPCSSIRWPVHVPPSEDNRNVHQTRSHGLDLLPLSSRYPSPRLAFLSPHLTLIPHSCLIPRYLEEVSLFPHPIHRLLCRKALWDRSAHPAISIYWPPIDSFKGVILSTAFVHLLQDAFDRLQDPQVKQYTDIGRWTGLIVQVQPLIGSTNILMILAASPPCF
jgi:hypothetical protein